MNRHQIVLFSLVCVLTKTQSEENTNIKTNSLQTKDINKDIYINDNVRVKRANHYSYPSKFYRLPPAIHYINGPFSITPPPKLKREEFTKDQPFKPSRAKRPTQNDGLRDEDIMNIVKYLSKNDLDKLLEFADDKKRTYQGFDQNYERPTNTEGYKQRPYYDDEKRMYNNKDKGWQIEYSDTLRYAKDFPQSNTLYSNTNSPMPEAKDMYQNSLGSQNFPNFYQTQQSVVDQIGQNTDMAFLNAHIANEINNNFQDTFQNNSPNYPKTTEEELLPKPLNLRENSDYPRTRENLVENLPAPENLRKDNDVSYSNKVEKVVQPDSYALENFGALPLMSRDSKLDSVSSYYVPHYTVTSSTNKRPQSSQTPKTPSYSESERGEASLKAVKIWAHRSTGIAYTLHDDGTLSLEKKPQ